MDSQDWRPTKLEPKELQDFIVWSIGRRVKARERATRSKLHWTEEVRIVDHVAKTMLAEYGDDPEKFVDFHFISIQEFMRQKGRTWPKYG
jgi:hypothetical protein